MIEFVEFKKIPRLSREVVITEKLDGTNASVYIGEEGEFLTGSRSRWITPQDDNYGFSKWAHENQAELEKLGPGTHYGEWWGQGIQKRYQTPKRFSLFNVHRWAVDRPACCDVVPVLYEGIFSDAAINACLAELKASGSKAAPGCMNPEGIIIFHKAANQLFKKTLEKDEEWKGKSAAQ